MKYLKLFDSYHEGKNSYVTHNGINYDLDKLLKIARKKKSSELETSKLKWILKHDKLSKRRVKLADTKFPLIVVKEKGKHVVLDGVHRLTKALADDIKSLPAKIITKKELAKCRRSIINEELTDFTKDLFNLEEGYLICVEEHPKDRLSLGLRIIYHYIFIITSSEAQAKKILIENWAHDTPLKNILYPLFKSDWFTIISELDKAIPFPITNKKVRFLWSINGLEPKKEYLHQRYPIVRHFTSADEKEGYINGYVDFKSWLDDCFINTQEILLKIKEKTDETFKNI